MSARAVQIADRQVGEGEPCFVVAEIGINHNGDLDTAKRLIDAAVDADCDVVKFQKHSVEVVYSVDEVARPRENPFARRNGDLKRARDSLSVSIVSLPPPNVLAEVNDAITFSILDTGKMRPAWLAGRWPGTVRMRLKWSTTGPKNTRATCAV